MHCDFTSIGFGLLYQIKQKQITERENRSKGDQNG